MDPGKKNVSQDQRPVSCSCETFLKRSLMSDTDGKVEEVTIHGIARVFCPPENRRGYAARHMMELAKAIHTSRSDQAKAVGSVLYSDVRKDFYAKLGWQPNATNWHVEFTPMDIPRSSLTQELVEDDLAEHCKRDETIIRAAMAKPTHRVEKLFTVLPDLDHMLWHIGKENFATEQLFGKIPPTKRAIAGQSAN